MPNFRARPGLTRLDVVALLVTGFVVSYVSCVALVYAAEQDRAKDCIDNLRKVGQAVFNYGNDNGKYPGYMNVLQRNDGTAYVDPESQEPTPVSWAVMILPYLDQRPLYDEWRNAADPKAPDATIELFVCPNDVEGAPKGPHLSYVANTAMPDMSEAKPPGPMMPGLPRDWAAGGMFFDNFSEHQLVKPEGKRGPMEIMSDARIKDPAFMTILLTENVDATEYVIRTKKHSADHWKRVEVQMGCTWQVGPVDRTTTPPTMKPLVASLQPNIDAGKGDGTKYDYCRPSSHHPGTVNVCFVDQNVQPLKDKISYFIFAKLMASDDDNLKEVGANKLLDVALRQYPIIDN